jgi:hypothetical protein
MDLDEIQQPMLENKVKEMHSNVRHITQLAMNWFVFFVTINYATMGWLAGGTVSLNRGIISLIASVFIIQNFLGIVSLNETEAVLTKMTNQVVWYEKLLINKGHGLCIEIKAKSIPIELYTNLKKYTSWVLISLIVAWALYAIIRLFLT